MSDQLKHSPINIPIEAADDDVDVEEDPADIIEIDGDDLVYDPDDLIEVDEDELETESPSSDDLPKPRMPITTESLDPYVPPHSIADALEEDDLAVVESVTDDDVIDEVFDAAGEDGVEDDEAADVDARPEDAGEASSEDETTTVSKQAVVDLMTELRQKSESIARLTDERSDLYDKLLRKQAEFENFRKRGEREMQEAYVRARADLMLDLLPVLDNFDLAVQHADTANPDAVHEGVHLIYKQLFDSLCRMGLVSIEADGQPFDPELHDAVATEPTDEVPDHTVLVVLQRGYMLGDRMLRPARVKVAVTP